MWGGKSNFKKIVQRMSMTDISLTISDIKKFVILRRYENVDIDDILDGVKVLLLENGAYCS